jgi:hypothetical protein
MLDSRDLTEFRNWLEKVKKDKITEILIENSNLTKIQFETFLIDLFFRQNNFFSLEKYKLRLNKDKISRGAFNHTRQQAINNVIRSIYTVLLLGYYGVLETPQLEPFIEGANRLHSYVDSVKEGDIEDLERNLTLLGDILKNELVELSSRRTYYK